MSPALATLEIRYFAAAKAAVGIAAETVEAPAGTTLDALAVLLTERHGEELGRVLKRCSYLVDEVAARDHERPLPASAVVDVLPPFAGG